MNPLLERSDMARDSKGITQFYLPPTHEPHLPLLPSRRASPPFGRYLLRLPTKGWPGWVDLGDWLYTEIVAYVVSRTCSVCEMTKLILSSVSRDVFQLTWYLNLVHAKHWRIPLLVLWLVQVWSLVMEETERLIELMQTFADRLALNTLHALTQIVSEKKLVRKLYAEKRNSMDMELDRVCSNECFVSLRSSFVVCWCAVCNSSHLVCDLFIYLLILDRRTMRPLTLLVRAQMVNSTCDMQSIKHK